MPHLILPVPEPMRAAPQLLSPGKRAWAHNIKHYRDSVHYYLKHMLSYANDRITVMKSICCQMKKSDYAGYSFRVVRLNLK